MVPCEALMKNKYTSLELIIGPDLVLTKLDNFNKPLYGAQETADHFGSSCQMELELISAMFICSWGCCLS